MRGTGHAPPGPSPEMSSSSPLGWSSQLSVPSKRKRCNTLHRFDRHISVRHLSFSFFFVFLLFHALSSRDCSRATAAMTKVLMKRGRRRRLQPLPRGCRGGRGTKWRVGSSIRQPPTAQ